MSSFHTTVRNNMGQQLIDFADDAALLRVYTAGFATLLVEATCGTPFAPAPSGGVVTLTTVPDETALASGDAAVARLYQADGTTIVINDMSVGDSASSADVKLDQVGTTITSGNPVVFDNPLTITMPNA